MTSLQAAEAGADRSVPPAHCVLHESMDLLVLAHSSATYGCEDVPSRCPAGECPCA